MSEHKKTLFTASAIGGLALLAGVTIWTLSGDGGVQSAVAQSADDQSGAQQGLPPALVTTTLASSGEQAASQWLPGTVISSHDARIAAEQSGRVIWVAEIGSMIQAGEAVAKLDDRELQLQRENHQSQIESLESQLAYQDSQVQRLESLSSNNSVAASQLEETRSQAEVVRQQLAQANIQLRQTQLQLERTKVSAPFNGQLVNRMVQMGEHVSAGAEIARLVDIDNREVRVQVPLNMADNVSNGMPVAMRSDLGESEETIKAISQVADENSRMFEMRVHAQNPRWRIGSPVQVALPEHASAPEVTIPRDALVLRGDRQFVYRVVDETSVEQIDVETGMGLGELVEVLRGLQVGDEVVVRGAERLQPGQQIQIVTRPSVAAN